MIKKIVYFVLSILAILYIGTLVADAVGVINASALGEFATVLQYFKTYGAVAIVFLYACTNFTGNIFKIVLFILLLLVMILYILVQFEAVNDFFRSIVGL